MTHQSDFPTTLQEAMIYFADPEKSFAFMVGLRWPDGKPTCPHCLSDRASFLSTRKTWKCMACHKQFSAKVGTIFEDSALGYDKWFPAMWMIVNAKNGISSFELARAFNVTQKTAWFMNHRIRLALQNGSIVKFKGNVEVDETYIGGKARFMHKDVKARKLKGGKGSAGKEIVQGLLDRENGKVRLMHVRSSEKDSLDANVRANVVAGSNVYTDAHSSYVDLKPEFKHEFVDHAERYVDGKVHTNGLENFWSLLKRSLKGTYVSVEPFHLFRYLDEQAFRFNERKDCDQGRFLKAVAGIVGRRITYMSLTGEGAQPA